MLRPESRFREAADIWMGKIRARRADSTADTYDHCLRKQVLPQLGELRLYECATLGPPQHDPRPGRDRRRHLRTGHHRPKLRPLIEGYSTRQRTRRSVKPT